jgi:hypothetical protein
MTTDRKPWPFPPRLLGYPSLPPAAKRAPNPQPKPAYPAGKPAPF